MKNFLKPLAILTLLIFCSCANEELDEEFITTLDEVESIDISTNLTAKTTPVVGGTYVIVNSRSGRTLDVNGASNNNSANVQLWGTNTSSAPTHRQWEVISTDNGYVRLRGVDSQKTLQTGKKTANGSTANQYAYANKDWQEWEITSRGNDLFSLKNRYSGKVLTAYGADNGSNVVIHNWISASTQKWYFYEVGGTSSGGGNTPGAILGLTNNDWKLNGFTANPNSSATYYDDVMDQVNGNIATWQNSNYFFENNGWAYFKCYRGLGGSNNSNNPRVELREMDGGNEEYWNGDSGSHIMSFTVRVDQLPNGWDEDDDEERTSGTLCFAQIHGPDNNNNGVEVDDTIRVQFEGTRGQTSGSVKLKISGYITEKVLGGSQTFTGYSLDTSYNMQLRFINDVVSLVINGSVVFSQEMDTSGDNSYFKIGNYLQSVQDGSFDGSYGLVGFKNLSISGH